MQPGTIGDSGRRGQSDYVVEVRSVSKYFGALQAVDQASLGVRGGEVLCLVGDNGAGKSTLIKVITGVHRPDEGEILVGGESYAGLTTLQARQLGIEAVYQDLALCDTLSASANVMLGQEPVRLKIGPVKFIDERESAHRAGELIGRVGAAIPDLHTRVARLSGGQRQAVAIARALVKAHRLVILDEPTAALGVTQTQASLILIRKVAEQGVGVVMISHSLEDVFRVADRIVVLRLGAVVLDTPAASTNRREIVSAMTGMDDLGEDL